MWVDRSTSITICVILSFWQAMCRSVVNSGKEENSDENSKENPVALIFGGSFYDTEVIEVNDEEHKVRKRDNCTVGNNFVAASTWVSINNAFQDFTCFDNNCMQQIYCIGTTKGFSLQMLQPIWQLTAATICDSDKYYFPNIYFH